MKTARLAMAGDVVVPALLVAERTRERMRGLLGRNGLSQGTGLLLDPCGAIHTFGMRFALDVIFVDRRFRVCRVVQHVHPRRFCLGGWRARATIELEAGQLDLTSFALGSQLEVD